MPPCPSVVVNRAAAGRVGRGCFTLLVYTSPPGQRPVGTQTHGKNTAFDNLGNHMNLEKMENYFGLTLNQREELPQRCLAV